MTGLPSNPSGAMIKCSAGANWGTTLDAWYGLVLRDLFLSDGSINLDVAAVRDSVAVENVVAPSGKLKLLNYATALPVSQWKTRAFNAANYTANNSMTWTVEAGDISSETWKIIGTTMIFSFVFIDTSVGGTPSTQLRIALPAGYKSKGIGESLAEMVLSAGGAEILAAIYGSAGPTVEG